LENIQVAKLLQPITRNLDIFRRLVNFINDVNVSHFHIKLMTEHWKNQPVL